MKKKDLFIGFLLIGALSMLFMSFHYLIQENSGILSRKTIKDALWYKITFRLHVSMGILAIFSGPFQFMNKLRIQHLLRHKRLGYIYSTAVLFASLSGLAIAPYSMGGLITAVGFSLLSLLWFLSIIMAVAFVLKGQIQAHKNWMYINYGLTFAAITQRSMLLFALIPGISFMPVYQLSAWLPWMINLCLVSLFFIPQLKSYIRISIASLSILTALAFLL